MGADTGGAAIWTGHFALPSVAVRAVGLVAGLPEVVPTPAGDGDGPIVEFQHAFHETWGLRYPEKSYGWRVPLLRIRGYP